MSPSCQIPDNHFTSDAERKQWAEDKWATSAHLQVNFPDKVHDNWKLTEKYCYFHKGKTGGRETEIEEHLSREATDAAGASSMLSLGDVNPKGRGKGGPEKHKALASKVNGALARLGRSLSACEQLLPSLKRKVSGETCQRLKEGLAAVRELRDQHLDSFEDLKKAPADGDYDMYVDQLTMIHKALLEGNDTLMEAFRKHSQATTVKEDVDAYGEAGVAGDLMRA